MTELPVRVGVFTGSPVPYKIPLYRRLAQDPRLDFTAIFASSGGVRPYDDGYGRAVVWDVDLLSGYRNIFLRKADRSPILGTSFLSVRDPDIVRKLVRGRYEVLWVEGYNSATHLTAVMTQRVLGGRVIMREEQTTLHPRPLAKTLVKEIAVRGFLSMTDAAMYISSENRRWFEHYGVADRSLFSAPYSVDNEDFRRRAAELAPARARLRAEFGISPDAGPVILTVARLIPKKQPQFLLEAFRRVRETRRCTLLIAGSGPLEEELHVTVERERIPDVVFAGFLNQQGVSRAYAVADVFALLSLEHETFGVVVNEAMNFSLPIVVTRSVGCAADLVAPRVNGFVVSPWDPQEAADALERLVANDSLRDQMGAASSELIADWDVSSTARGVVDAVAAVVGPSRWADAPESGRARWPAESRRASRDIDRTADSGQDR